MKRRHVLPLMLWPSLAALPAHGRDAKAMHISTLLEDDPATAFAESQLREAYRRLGLKLVVEQLPGERSLVQANSGQLDGELYRKTGMDREYPNLVVVPVVLMTYEIVIFSQTTEFVVTGWESLRPFTIGFVRGIKIIQENTRDMKVEPVATMQQAFQKMTMGRTDIVVGNRISGLAVVQSLQLKDVRILQPSLASFPVYHYLHKKHEALVPKLAAVLRQVQAERAAERNPRK